MECCSLARCWFCVCDVRDLYVIIVIEVRPDTPAAEEMGITLVLPNYVSTHIFHRETRTHLGSPCVHKLCMFRVVVLLQLADSPFCQMP